jgi:hypothetical protein
MMVVLPLVALYAVFLLWYGGRGKPMRRDEIDRLLAPLRERVQDQAGQSLLADVERLVESDDGCEFVLHNVSLFYAEDQSPRGEGDERCVSAADV